MWRRLQIEIDEMEGKKISRYRYFLAWADEVWDKILTKCKYYDVRNFVINLPHFLRQAWRWRGFDHSYTINAFADNLKRLGKELKRHGNCILSERNSRRALIASDKLRKAYEDDFIFVDKSYLNWCKNNEVYFDEIKSDENKGMYEMKYKRKYSTDYSNKMWKIINKRHVEQSKARKREAWEYIHKYIEMWWD